ncbi:MULTISPECIES: hypothetical protein [Streptomyces]|uniref:Uncharacterized protein n=1 Tax=Streptomyces dengpaensis TaxID=2049881 RepID=A0ABN5IAZ5_9ACTN|nr:MULTISPECIES: hypothetical protein [Streptomyces]AVH60331.1 hypothetical protein C4B68_36165 [Streptomyces dengpaensis]PIB06659.1 hypothetical protein B1C81_23265 [Streptomyces sp. HG99]
MPVGFGLLSVVGDSRLEPLVLSETERQVLNNWVKRRRTSQGLALRARIVGTVTVLFRFGRAGVGQPSQPGRTRPDS